MQQFHKFISWRLRVAQYVSGLSTPIIRSLQLNLTASGFTLERGSSVVDRGLAGYTVYNRPDPDQQRCYHHVPR
jgi:hypothetical protein